MSKEKITSIIRSNVDLAMLIMRKIQLETELQNVQRVLDELETK